MAVITHAASLRQGSPHCAIFPTAASRRSLGRVSVPMWLIILSDQLPVFALVGRYPTNKLIGRRLILKCDLHRFNTSEPTNVRYLVLTPVSRRYLSLEGRSSTCYSPVRRSLPKQLARLACIKHAASVRPEPGSNSPVKSFSHSQRSV